MLLFYRLPYISFYIYNEVLFSRFQFSAMVTVVLCINMLISVMSFVYIFDILRVVCYFYSLILVKYKVESFIKFII